MRLAYTIVFMLLILWSCNDDPVFNCFENSGATKRKTLTYQPFNKIQLNDVFDVYLIQDTICQLEAEGGANLIENIDVDINGAILSIKNSSNCNWLRDYKRMALYIHYTGLKEIL